MTLLFETRCHVSKVSYRRYEAFATLLLLRNYAVVLYHVARQLHSATDVKRVLPAGAESQARHPRITPIAVTPI